MVSAFHKINYFFADNTEQNLDVWEYTAGCMVKKQGDGFDYLISFCSGKKIWKQNMETKKIIIYLCGLLYWLCNLSCFLLAAF
jgi:hypothetical protein